MCAGTMNVISCSHAVRGRGEKTGIDVTAQHTNRPAVKKEIYTGEKKYEHYRCENLKS